MTFRGPRRCALRFDASDAACGEHVASRERFWSPRTLTARGTMRSVTLASLLLLAGIAGADVEPAAEDAPLPAACALGEAPECVIVLAACAPGDGCEAFPHLA